MFKTIRLGGGRSGTRIVAVASSKGGGAATTASKGGRSARGSARRTAPARGGEAAALAERALQVPGFKADTGETIALGRDGVVLGLGAAASISPASMRTAGARLVRALDRMGLRSVRLSIADAIPPQGSKEGAADAETLGRAFGEGMALANWRVDHFDGTATRRAPALGALAMEIDDASFRAGVDTGLLLGEAVNLTRRLGATPPNICHPAWVVATARRLARELGLRCRVIDFREAQRLGMGGLVNVGRASATKPALVLLEHAPRRPAPGARREHLVLVGKTITYDTGGYSLKVNNGMKGMKYDKMGGMAVLGAMQAIAKRRLPVRVTGILAVAENMVGGDAYRPDDIITMHNGVTVEVTNTDAEGRLVLADALSYACRTLAPTAIVDIATLTGGVVVALGHFSAGYFCGNPLLRRRLEDASAESGDRIWQLPLWPEHRDFMRGQHADLINSNPQRSAHPIQGAAFLSYFVDDSIPWAHVDIAGVDSVESGNDLFVQGPTGYGVRLLADLAEGFTQRAPRVASA